MRVLCVAEKPSIAKSITQILSGGQYTTSNSANRYIKNYEFDYPQLNAHFTVTSVVGHLFEYDFGPQYKNWSSCDPFVLFDVPVEHKVAEDKNTVANNLKRLAPSHQELVIWTDCDREGENIGSEVMTVCRSTNRQIRVRRARFSAIIAGQIQRAAQNTVELDMRQAASVEARSIIDLRVGATITRMQTLGLQRLVPQLKDQKLMSYGPCQFPTLGFVVSRYEQVKSFVPESFWFIYLSVARDPRNEEDQTEFTWRRGRLFDFDIAVALYEYVLENAMATVTKVTKKNVKKWKPLPLTTVELQKSGSRLLRMAPKKILDVAEKLYQDGFLSYPRTETDIFDPQFDHAALIAKQVVDPAWGGFATGLQQGGYAPPRRGKKDDHAHPPIHPTAHAGNLTGDAKRVYEFVTRRYLACCSKDAEGFETTVDIVSGGEDFYATGLVVLARNYLDVYPYDKWGDKALPDFEEGQEFMPSVCELRDGQTSQPNLLTEADLVGLMDKNGIGTDATIAQHIQTIIDREYVIARKEGATTYLVPSNLGIGLVEGYSKVGLERSLSKPQLRRETERMMVQVCNGAKTKAEMIDESVEQYKHVPFGNTCLITGPKRGTSKDASTYQTTTTVTMPGAVGVAAEGAEEEGEGLGEEEEEVQVPQEVVEVEQPDGKHVSGFELSISSASLKSSGILSLAPPNDSDEEDFFTDRRPPGGGGIRAEVDQPRPAPAAARQPARPPSDGEVLCDCGEPAAERSVTRETANKGRKFRTCETKKCEFFEWVQPEGGSNKVIPAKRARSESTNPSTRIQNGSSSTAGGTRKCRCELTAVSRVTQNEGPNKGRSYWTCPNTSSKAKCGFFEWDDGPSGSSGAYPLNVGASGSGNKCYKCDEPGHFANARNVHQSVQMVRRELGHKLQQVQVTLVIWYAISARNLVISQTVAPTAMAAARVEVVIGQGALEMLAASPETASHAGWPATGRRIVQAQALNRLEVVQLPDRPSRVAEPEVEVEEPGQEVEGSGAILKTLMKSTSSQLSIQHPFLLAFSFMDEIGIEIQKEEPTFGSVVTEKTALMEELQATEDYYTKYKKLTQHLEMLEIQESYIKEEQANLKRELIRAQEEVKRIQSVPLVIGQFLEPIDQHTGIVGSTTGSNHVVRILSTLDRELLKPSSSVALHRHSNALVDILPPEADSSIALLGADEKPDVAYTDVGGMDTQKQEIREAVELPLTQFDLYKKIGIDPPRGVLLYGPPGTGKTMLVKAVAHHTTAAFIRVVGSEFVQKYLGEGPRMVRDVFRLARENAPAIIFIDEIDAIATKRFDAQTGADREVQRILLELLNQMDGFDQGSNVKVIMATNRADTLDPALLRPGRLDRKIEFPLPSRREKRLIFQTITGKMNLSPDVDLEDYVSRPDKISSAECASICQAAGLQAVRKNRYVILPADFEEAWKQTVKRSDETHEFYR
ncbi:DNA topoisomerase [Tulasnella sp. UAMH 9824]|nr:DNA topoisomerase [Tulasnella sp. UAMH 9824]